MSTPTATNTPTSPPSDANILQSNPETKIILPSQPKSTITKFQSQLATEDSIENVYFSSKANNSSEARAYAHPESEPFLFPQSTSILKKFKLLIWKNYVLQKRHKCQTALEIFLPLFLISIQVVIRGVINSEKYPEPMLFSSWSPTNFTQTVIQANINEQRRIFSTKPKPPLYTVFYVPDKPKITETMKLVQKNFLTFAFPGEKFKIRSFANEKQMLEEYGKQVGGVLVLGAVVFQDTTIGDQITYKLRMPAAYQNVFVRKGSSALSIPRWYTSLTYPEIQLLGPRHFDDFQGSIPGYYSQGFTYLQFAVDVSIIQMVCQSSVQSGCQSISVISDLDSKIVKINDFVISLQRFPHPPFIDDVYIIALERQLSLMIMLSFIYPFVNITKSILIEKEKKLKESMKMMGLPNYLHWSAWFLKSFLFLLICLAFMVAQLKIKWKDGLAIIQATHETILVVFLLAYIFSSIMFAFFVSTLFSRANSAATGAGVVWFLSYFPYFFLAPRYNTLSHSVKTFLCVFSNTAMALGWQIILMHEGTSAGVHWSTIASGCSLEDDFSLLHCIVMLVIDGLIYFILTIYIEGVFPGEFGVPMPWNFPFLKTYWCGNGKHQNVNDQSDTISEVNSDVEIPLECAKAKAGIRIQGLSKTFGRKEAVRNLNLCMYENQITVLLGHNGAGKTTTMSMLTGLLPPTSGTAIINDFDIRTNIKDVRRSLGLCPEHNVLFDELTCEEHLKFFCWMKGCKNVTEEVNNILSVLCFESKRHVQAGKLSGGMKRKLSVGIALVGGSKVVLLDEPTSGMDPGARRSTWDLLTSEKQNRTILLSTHFMDEADLLGDRIAIMADGHLACVGSSLFLKKRFGAGYHLVVVKKSGCDISQITELITKYIGEAKIEQNVGAELSYALPDSKSELFADMFEEMEERRGELMIDSYGAGITTMEEVFVRVGKEVEERKKSIAKSSNDLRSESIRTANTHNNYKLFDEHHYNSGFALIVQQFRAMMTKKWLYLLRNRILFLCQTIIPAAFLLLAIIVILTFPKFMDNPSLRINLDKFQNPVTTLSCQAISDPFCSSYERLGGELNTRIQKTKSFTDFILSQSQKSLISVNQRYIVGLEKSGNNITGFFNNQPYHGLPITLNLMTNALFRHLTSNNKKRIIVNNHPFSYLPIDEIENANGVSTNGFKVGFNVTFGISFLASSFVIFLISERESKAKHLQFVSGARFWIFWLANFIFDFLLYLVTCVLLIIELFAFQAETLKDPEVLGLVFVIFIFYGWAVIPLMYVFSFWFTTPSSGFVRMTMFNLFSGLASILAVTILQIPSLKLLDTAAILDKIFMIFPNYNLGYGIIQISKNVLLHGDCPKIEVFQALDKTCILPEFKDNLCCTDYPYDYTDLHPAGIGRNLLSLFVIGFLNFVILIIKEGELMQKKNKTKVHALITMNEDSEDLDVAAEATRIRSSKLENLLESETFMIKDLSKSYGSFRAVQCLNLGVKQNECFGLLGVNGAGKTTMFKMLTGDLRASSGDAFVCRNSINSDIKNVQKNLGYCPQFDALIDQLTGRELIRLFARLRGIQEQKIDDLANKLGDSLLFREHIDKRVGSYSGGNKRKLSTALALIGNPPLVFLDEPSTGMDPVARRHLWNCISKVRASGTSVVLSSHNMEECEALCTRLVIMVNGRFCCLGSIQQLKSKFGQGYTVTAQLRIKTLPDRKSLQEIQQRRSTGIDSGLVPWELEMQPLQQFIENAFPGAILKDFHPGYVHYHVTNPRIRWSVLFRKMEQAKIMFHLKAYSVGQTTLEQVFINFTKTQVVNDMLKK